MPLAFPPCWVLCSGGKDSLSCAAYVASRDRLLGLIALDTGIHTPDWRDFLDAEAKRHRWALRVFHTTAQYEVVVGRYGFPGPAQHGMVMNYLKGRAIRACRRELGDVPLASGVRQAESSRRAIGTKPISTFEKMTVYAPIYDWSTEATWAYFHAKGLQRAPGYATLGISGDCLCGAFNRKDEREVIDECYPAVAARIAKLERAVRHHGDRGVWGWGAHRSEVAKKKKAERVICVECEPAAE